MVRLVPEDPNEKPLTEYEKLLKMELKMELNLLQLMHDLIFNLRWCIGFAGVAIYFGLIA